MKIEKLLENVEGESLNVNFDDEIDFLCLNDKNCKENCAFFCIKGNNKDGADFADSAIKNGAKLIICERRLDVAVGQYIVKDVRLAMLEMSMNLYDNPQKKLRTIGVVGTNGKTTVCSAISEILNNCGIKCGKIGSFGAEYDDFKEDTGFTTPDSPEIFRLLDEMVGRGVKAVCMELSAHAIYYKKVNFRFDILVFTNCTQDHLDFFETFDKYKEVKQSAFSATGARVAVVNGDDKAGREICATRDGGVISYAINSPADIFAIDVRESDDGIKFVLNLFDTVYEISCGLYGVFNVYNLMAAATACALCGLKTDEIASTLNTLTPIEGRMEKVCNKINVFIDYAHTPDGLKQALKTLKKIKPVNKKLICIFGCGGNRDKEKRPLMGEISGKYADFTVITSDNPRFEDEHDIIKSIEKGLRMTTSEYITISDRRSAIEYAVQRANAGDYILIAGKGAEKYQEIMGANKQFSDKQTVISLILSKYD